MLMLEQQEAPGPDCRLPRPPGPSTPFICLIKETNLKGPGTWSYLHQLYPLEGKKILDGKKKV